MDELLYIILSINGFTIILLAYLFFSNSNLRKRIYDLTYRRHDRHNNDENSFKIIDQCKNIIKESVSEIKTDLKKIRSELSELKSSSSEISQSVTSHEIYELLSKTNSQDSPIIIENNFVEEKIMVKIVEDNGRIILSESLSQTPFYLIPKNDVATVYVYDFAPIPSDRISDVKKIFDILETTSLNLKTKDPARASISSSKDYWILEHKGILISQ